MVNAVIQHKQTDAELESNIEMVLCQLERKARTQPEVAKLNTAIAPLSREAARCDLTASENGLNRLARLLVDRVDRLPYRTGLVGNYIITQAQAPSTGSAMNRFIHSVHRLESVAVRSFLTADFRHESAHAEFECIAMGLGRLLQLGAAQEVRKVLSHAAKKSGNTPLHTLVKRRQLKFVKTLLFHCGPAIDWGTKNRAGFTALGLALDRLEVEMAQLMLAHGAKIGAGENLGRSLKFSELLTYDLARNIDTGRWLNRQALRALSVFADNTPGGPQLLDWASGNEPLDDTLLMQVSQLPQLFAINLGDGCDAITNHEAWSGLIRFVLRRRAQGLVQSAQPGIDLDEKLQKYMPAIERCSAFESWLANQGVENLTPAVAGRTLFYKRPTAPTLAVKLAKANESKAARHPLLKEGAIYRWLCAEKTDLGLNSAYPKTVAVLNIKNLPVSLQQQIVESSKGGFHQFDLGIKAQEITALIYEAPEGYDSYVNDRQLDQSLAQQGLRFAAYDLGIFASRGVFHTALADLQHDASNRTRPHVWSFESFLTRFRVGAGRIASGFSGFATPNVRCSGLADLKHLSQLSQARTRFDPAHLHTQHNLLFDAAELDSVLETELLGAAPFALSVLAASRWLEGNAAPDVEVLQSLEHDIRDCFAGFIQGYLGVSNRRALELLTLMHFDPALIARQFGQFCTAQHVVLGQSLMPRPFFGIWARVLGTSLPHLSQRACGQDGTPPEIKALFAPAGHLELPAGFPRVDLSTMRCSPNWHRTHGWQKGRLTSFGAREGVFPVQRLIRDNFVLSYMLRLLKSDLKTQRSTVKCEDSNSASGQSPSSGRVGLMLRPLQMLQVRIDSDTQKPLSVGSRFNQLFFRPPHVALVVEQEDHPVYVASAGYDAGRCVFADTLAPKPFLINDSKAFRARSEAVSERLLFQSLPLSATLTQVVAQRMVREGNEPAPRYGPRFLGGEHCQSRLSRELLREALSAHNAREKRRMLQPDYTPAFVFPEDLALPKGAMHLNWHP